MSMKALTVIPLALRALSCLFCVYLSLIFKQRVTKMSAGMKVRFY